MKDKLLGFFPSYRFLSPQEKAELDGLIFKLASNPDVIRFLTIYSLATQDRVDQVLIDPNYELGNRDAIMNIRNLFMMYLEPDKE